MEQNEFDHKMNKVLRKTKRNKIIYFSIAGLFILFLIINAIIQNANQPAVHISNTDYERGISYFNENNFVMAKWYLANVKLQKDLAYDSIYYNAQAKIKICEQKIPEQKAEEERLLKIKNAEEQKWLKTKAGRYYTFCQSKGVSVSKNDCVRTANDEIWIGMNIWLVIARRGNPNSINTSNYGRGNEYQYCWNDWDPSCFYDDNNDNLIDSYN